MDGGLNKQGTIFYQAACGALVESWDLLRNGSCSLKKTCILLLCTFVGCSGTMSHSAAVNAIRSHFAQDRQFMLLNVGRVGADCIFDVNGKETHFDWTPEKEINTVTAVAAGYLQ